MIKTKNDFKKIKDNKFIGTIPELIDSTIIFNGKNNVLYCDEGVTLENSKIVFNGDNALVYLSTNHNNYKLGVSINNNCFLYFGKNNYINDKMVMVLSEEKNIFIGDECLFSTGIVFRNADPHLVFDSLTHNRLNFSKSIYLGDHIWLGQDSIILKGTMIDSGSIIGAGTVVSGKKIKHNTSNVGNPIKQIRKNVFWSGECVHTWTKKDTNEHMIKGSNKWNYKYNKKEVIDFLSIDKETYSLSAENKYNYFKNLDTSKNRFVHKYKRKNKLINKVKTRVVAFKYIAKKVIKKLKKNT